jgi:succinyl-CoA synthetase beta subunit
MKLFEYEAKEILSDYKIQVPQGALATSLSQVKEISRALQMPLTVKAQILVSGRGKAGGIFFVHSPTEAQMVAKKLLGTKIKGCKVQYILLEEKLSIKRELYFGVTIDRLKKCLMAVASSAGGMEIEEVANSMPEKIIRFPINSLHGFRSYHAIKIAKKLDYSGDSMLKLAKIFGKLYKVAIDYDAQLIETNPLVETIDKTFIAADARVIVDDNSLYRQPKFKKRLIKKDKDKSSVIAMKARSNGLAYVKLKGNIGIIGNGAGLVMATLDTIQLYGGKPANFLDIGGGASIDRMAVALDIVLSDTEVNTVFINILGGITRCDEVAKAILSAKEQGKITKPMVIRLVGTEEDKGTRILREAGISVLNNMEDAAKKAVELASNKG